MIGCSEKSASLVICRCSKISATDRSRGWLMTMPMAPLSPCSQIYVMLWEKMPSPRLGMASRKWSRRQSLLLEVCGASVFGMVSVVDSHRLVVRAPGPLACLQQGFTTLSLDDFPGIAMCG